MEADVPARSTDKVQPTPHTPVGDFTLADSGNLEVPRIGGVIACKSAARCAADTVLVLRRGLTATTGNQIVERPWVDKQFLLEQEAALLPGFKSGVSGAENFPDVRIRQRPKTSTMRLQRDRTAFGRNRIAILASALLRA
jgi:hypothetical protein